MFAVKSQCDEGAFQKSGEIEKRRGKDIAAQCDVIIHTALDRQADTETLDRNMVRFLLETIRVAAQPKTLIYTSCIWVLSNLQRQPLTEQSHISPPQELEWRLEVEKTVLKAEFTKGLVIRPGVVYGRQGGLTGMWFHGAIKCWCDSNCWKWPKSLGYGSRR